MRTFLLGTSILGGSVISICMIAQADPFGGSANAPPAEAPAVHVQPRAKDFDPHSAASEAEQSKVSTFDAKQQKLDEALDNKLSICRC
jgi:hypothetical protein